MFPYTEKYTESESDIQNNDSLYKIHPKCKNTFNILDVFQKLQRIKIWFCNMYNFHTSYFIFFVYFVCLYILAFPKTTFTTAFTNTFMNTSTNTFTKTSTTTFGNIGVLAALEPWRSYTYIYIYNVYIYIHKKKYVLQRRKGTI